MHFALLFPVFLVLVCLPETSTFMDCRPACQKCLKGSPTSDNLELYCSMCKECRDRNHDVKARSPKGEHKESPGGTRLSSTGAPHQFTKRLYSPGGLLAAAGGRLRPSIGMRGRLLRPRLDFMKKHPFGEGGRLGKTGNGAIRFLRGHDYTLDVAAHGAQILSKYASQPVNAAQLSSPRQYVTLTQTIIPTTLTTTVIKSKENMIVKMEQIEKKLHKQRNEHQILNELRNELQPNEDQLMHPNEMHRFQKDYVVKSLSEYSVNIPTFVPLEELRPLVIGDQIVYLHEATTARSADCPPPPPDCEEVTEKVLLLVVTTTSTTTTTATTTTEPQTPPPCPPIKCQKKQLCCPDCPCPEPQPPPPPLMLPPPPPMLPPPPPMLPPPPPMLPPPPPMLPPPPGLLSQPPPTLLPPPLPVQPPPPMLPQLMLQPPSLMLPPPSPMIPRPPLPMLPPQPLPMLSRPLQPMLPLPPLPPPLPPPPPPPPRPPIMAIPMVPQLIMSPPISMLNPQCMGNGCNHPHSIKPRGHAEQRWLSEQNVQYDKKGQGFPNIQGDYGIPFDNNIYEEYTGKIRITEYLRKKTTVTQHFNKDYYYLYVGVPKNNVKHLKNKLLREGVQSNTISTK